MSKIDWCDLTANPFTGCKHSCSFCYARRFAKRLSGIDGTIYNRLAKAGIDPFEPTFDFESLWKLDEMLVKAKKPKRVFLGSMSDLGGNWEWNNAFNLGHKFYSSFFMKDTIKKFIASHPRHTFLILTKNPSGLKGSWFGNAHIGVSASTYGEVLTRVPILIHEINAPVRWLSLEPLLNMPINRICLDAAAVDWLVIGAQTGPGAPAPKTESAKVLSGWYRFKKIPCFVKDNMIKADPDFDWPREFPK